MHCITNIAYKLRYINPASGPVHMARSLAFSATVPSHGSNLNGSMAATGAFSATRATAVFSATDGSDGSHGRLARTQSNFEHFRTLTHTVPLTLARSHEHPHTLPQTRSNTLTLPHTHPPSRAHTLALPHTLTRHHGALFIHACRHSFIHSFKSLVRGPRGARRTGC
jgi:hypothetical protein